MDGFFFLERQLLTADFSLAWNMIGTVKKGRRVPPRPGRGNATLLYIRFILPRRRPSSGELVLVPQSLLLIRRIARVTVVRVPAAGRVEAPRHRRRGFDLAGVQVTDDELGVLIDEHAGQRQHGAGAAERGELAAEEQLGQQQVAHHVQVAEDVEGDGGGEGDDAAAGQVVEDRAQAAEQDEQPQAAVVVQRPLQQGPVLQDQRRHGQDAEAGDGHQVEQEDGVDFLLLQQDA